MPNESAEGTAQARFDRIGAQATDSLRGDSRRLHELAEQFRSQYRRDLEEWMQLRARLGQLPGAVLDDGFSELDHAKCLYVSTHARGGAS